MRCRSARRATAAAGQPLTSANLWGAFGARAAMAREGIAALLDSLAGDDGSALACWKAHFGRTSPAAIARLPQLLARPAARYGVAAGAEAAARLLLAMQTYYALLVGELLERLSPGGVANGLADNPFAWAAAARSAAVGRFIGRLRQAMACYSADRRQESPPTGIVAAGPPGGPESECDVLGPLYQDLFPRPLRRQLGEYYTPDWLARHVLDQVGYTGGPAERLLDPACGSGTFLVLALRRLRHSSFDVRHFPIVGFDLNPLAVLSARANCLLAVADLPPELGRVEIPVYLHDSIQDRGEAQAAEIQPFDYVVGNPPWIAWDNLSEEDRRATKPLWEHYGLFSLSGSQARHGGGKKDLSMLMLYATADRYLRPGGRLGMVITQTLFQTLGAGDGFRRFRLGRDGPPLGVLRVDDLTALRPFANAANWTSTIVLEKGAATAYPVPYFRWTEEKGEGGSGNGETRFRQEALLARPIDPARPTSPWLIEGDDERGMMNGELQAAAPRPEVPSPCAAEYAAHLGANSGGANGVYWVEVLGPADGGLLVRNVAAQGKHRVAVVEAVIEPDLLYPLLRWGGVGRYRAAPGGCILLAQDPATRSGIAEAVMRVRWPRTLAYLQRFRELLVARAAYRRYQHGGPFYAMYNVGPYTIAPVKVVWRRMDRRLNAAVVETACLGTLPSRFGRTNSPHPSPLPEGEGTEKRPGDRHRAGRPLPEGDGTVARPIIPQETCVLVACDTTDEAHYLCAMLNSAAVNRRVAGHSVRGGKSFGTPGMFEFLPLRRYEPGQQRHRQLAALSRQAHAVFRSLPAEGAGDAAVADIQGEIDRLTHEMWRE